MAIKFIPAFGHTDEVRELFSEYTDMLVAGDASFKDYLDIQNYDEEIKDGELVCTDMIYYSKNLKKR